MRRPASLRTAAVAGSIALVGVLGIGAAAATGNAPEPVRQLFGASSSALRVEFEGVIVAIDANARTVDVDVAGDVRTVLVVDTTELSRGGDAILLEQFAVGDPVEVKGALQIDDTIIASRVHLEDDFADDDDPVDTPTVAVDDDNNAGPGNGEQDDGDVEDNSGPGNGEEDDNDAEDNSGPGNGEQDDADDDAEDNSGPGNADDEDEDGNSGTGNGDDIADTDDGNSGSGNSGPGGDGDHDDD